MRSGRMFPDIWNMMRKRPIAMLSLAVVCLYVCVAMAVGCGVLDGKVERESGGSYEPPSGRHLLGTDIFGRDVLSRVVYGAKISIMVGLISSCIAIPIGVCFGAFAGYFGGWVDDLIVWFYTTVDAVPGIVLILAMAYVFQEKTLFGMRIEGIYAVYMAIGLSSWVGICRLMRGEFIKHKEREYVMAARACGTGTFAVIFRHIFPNVSHIMIIDFSLRYVYAIESEVIISYLGFGVKQEPSWGVIIDAAKLELQRGVWWGLAGATGAMFVLVLALNVLGDVLRDALDPKMSLE